MDFPNRITELITEMAVPLKELFWTTEVFGDSYHTRPHLYQITNEKTTCEKFENPAWRK